MERLAQLAMGRVGGPHHLLLRVGGARQLERVDQPADGAREGVEATHDAPWRRGPARAVSRDDRGGEGVAARRRPPGEPGAVARDAEAGHAKVQRGRRCDAGRGRPVRPYRPGVGGMWRWRRRRGRKQCVCGEGGRTEARAAGGPNEADRNPMYMGSRVLAPAQDRGSVTTRTKPRALPQPRKKEGRV